MGDKTKKKPPQLSLEDLAGLSKLRKDVAAERPRMRSMDPGESKLAGATKPQYPVMSQPAYKPETGAVGVAKGLTRAALSPVTAPIEMLMDAKRSGIGAAVQHAGEGLVSLPGQAAQAVNPASKMTSEERSNALANFGLTAAGMAKGAKGLASKVELPSSPTPMEPPKSYPAPPMQGTTKTQKLVPSFGDLPPPRPGLINPKPEPSPGPLKREDLPTPPPGKMWVPRPAPPRPGSFDPSAPAPSPKANPVGTGPDPKREASPPPEPTKDDGSGKKNYKSGPGGEGGTGEQGGEQDSQLSKGIESGDSSMAFGGSGNQQFQAQRAPTVQSQVMQQPGQKDHKGGVLGTLAGVGIGLGTGNWAPLATHVLGSAVGGAVGQATSPDVQQTGGGTLDPNKTTSETGQEGPQLAAKQDVPPVGGGAVGQPQIPPEVYAAMMRLGAFGQAMPNAYPQAPMQGMG